MRCLKKRGACVDHRIRSLHETVGVGSTGGWYFSFETSHAPFCKAAINHAPAFDLFGERYGIEPAGSVVSIDAETGERHHFARDLEAWAALILEKPGSLLGAGLGRAWQRLHGPLAPLERLVPRQPFVLGGNYEVSNLVRCPLARALKLYGSLCEQIAAKPDGTEVEVRGWWPAYEP